MRAAACLAFAAILLAPAIASAQGTSTQPGATTAYVPSWTTSGLDLPVTEPIFGSNPNAPPPPVQAEDDFAEDPKDEPPPTIYGEEIDGKTQTIVYVIDVSGSMDWDIQPYADLEGRVTMGTRMERAKGELMRSISGLPRTFKFNCLAYDCGTFPWRSALQQADEANKAAAISWCRGLQPNGATGTGPATALALGMDRTNGSVVLLTDGIPNCGADGPDGHRAMIRTSNAQRAKITVFGIAANGGYRAFCQAVASDSGGSYFDVP